MTATLVPPRGQPRRTHRVRAWGDPSRELGPCRRRAHRRSCRLGVSPACPIGFMFLWAFFDKLLALGYATGVDRETGAIDRFGDAAWINGGSPTTGFLSGVTGPFKSVFEPMAGAAWADWLFMIGLLAIGTALMLGIGMRIAAASGALLLVFMWMASLPLDNNPVMDDHLVYAVVLIGLAAVHAGDTLGAGRAWARTRLVRRHPVLR